MVLQVASAMQDKGLLVGWLGADPIYYTGDAHVAVFGGTGKGKGVGYIIPWALDTKKPMIILDPKGDTLASTFHHRRSLGNVMVINPFNVGVSHLPFMADHGYNPMALWPADPMAEEVDTRSSAMGENVIIPTPHDPFWGEGAAEVVAALSLDIRRQLKGRATLGHVRAAITQATGDDEGGDPLGLTKILREIYRSGYVYASEKVGPYLNADSESAQGVIHTAVTQTRALGRASIRRSLAGPGFDWRRLKHEFWTVYIVLPANEMDRCRVWLRMVIGEILDAWSDRLIGRYTPWLIVDEAAQLRELYSLVRAHEIGRGYGFQVVTIWQLVEQIRKWYTSESFILANTGAAMTFGTGRDIPTAEMWAKLLGNQAYWLKSFGTNVSDNENATLGMQQSAQGFPVLHPDDIMRMPKPNVLVSMDGLEYPAILKAHPYFDTPWEDFGRNASPNPLREATAPDYYEDYEPEPAWQRAVIPYVQKLPHYAAMQRAGLVPWVPRRKTPVRTNGRGQ